MNKKILLHVCCGVCACVSMARLKQEGFSIEALFFNPNIHPYSEYLKRREASRKSAARQGIRLSEGKYKIFDWFKVCKPCRQDKEGGRRCSLCYEFRLKESFRVCREKQCDYFTTTLTISPHKASSVILEIGSRIGKDKFLPLDFKKGDGFKESMAAAKSLNLYRQNYCGCVYSKPR